MKTSLLLSLLLISSALVSHRATAEDTLPIPDVTAAITELRADDLTQVEDRQTRRKTILQGHIAQAENTTDPSRLRNYLDFATQARALLREIDEITPNQSRAESLLRITQIRLAEYCELNADTMVGYLRDLPNGAARYSVALFWSEKIKTFEDIQSLRQLALYFDSAIQVSKDKNDEAFITTTLDTAAKSVRKKIFQIYPIYDGIYSVTSRCDGDCEHLKFDRVVIMDSMANEDIVVSAVRSATESQAFTFPGVQIKNGGNRLENNRDNRSTSSFFIEFNVDTRAISGEVRSPSGRITFSGEPIPGTSPSDVYRRFPLDPRLTQLNASDFQHRFVGRYKTLEASVGRIEFLEDKIDQARVAIRIKGIREPLTYGAGILFPKSGYLVFTRIGGRGGFQKIALAVVRGQDGTPERLVGMGFSTFDASVVELEFTRADGQ